jgi:putative hydrolase of the HAD superfamily
MAYSHLFFDLDHTLWDVESNSRETISEIFDKYKLHSSIPSFEEFYTFYKKLNDELWDLYSQEKITKEKLRFRRFHDSFHHFGVNDYSLSNWAANDFVTVCSTKTNVVQYTHEVLEYLQKKYDLHIITNGFEESQHTKLKHSNLKKYFKEIITSEKAGFKKPDKRIFEYSLEITGSKKHEAIMIGDNLTTDIIGARGAGIDQVFFNTEKIKHTEKVSREIHSLKQLTEFL